METLMRLGAAAFTIAWLAACSSTWETRAPVTATTYQVYKDAVPRYAGKLRRLALLPVLLETDPPECRVAFPPNFEEAVHDDARRFLVDWKGYEVIGSEQTSSPSHRELSKALGRWQEKKPEEARPPELLRAKLQALAKDVSADGVIVIHAAPECPTAGDMVLNLLAIGMPNFYGKMFGRNFSAGVYEAASGSLVWQRFNNLLGSEAAGTWPITPHVEALLDGLENAIPEVLLRRPPG